jgi:inner membrane protein
VASHLLLDYTNAYGIRLLLPFSGRWFHLDLNSLIDLWIWAAFFVALVGPLLVRLVNAEIGAAGAGARRAFAIFALVFMALYDGGRAVAHTRAVAMLDSRLYGGAAPVRVAALPGPANPLAWRGLVETREAYLVEDVSLMDELDPTRGSTFYKAEPGPAITAANRTVVFRDFFRFSQYPLERAEPVADPEGGTEVEAMDMRFGTPVRPAFVAQAIVGGRMEVRQAWFSYGAARPR